MGMIIPPDKDVSDQKVDLRFWGIMQQVGQAALFLKNEHERAHKQLVRIEKPSSQQERDDNAERQVVVGTGGAPWGDVARTLNRLTSHGKPHVRSGMVSVSSAELATRLELKVGLSVLVNSIYRHADKHELLRKSTLKKGDAGAVSYQGRRLRLPLVQAFNALTEWDSYMAELETANVLARLGDPRYVPGSRQNPLAIPGPSVSSQPTAPRGPNS